MYLTDPTLYGATLPQREFPVTTPYFTPFFGQNLPMQIPWQQPYMWQNFQRFVPPVYQQFQQPFMKDFLPFKEFYGQFPYKEFGQFPYKEFYGQIPYNYMIPPFYGYQKPFWF